VSDDDGKLNALALSIMAAGHVEDMRDASVETGTMIAELLALPDLTANDLTEREAMLALLLWRKTEAAKRLLALVV
jgi:hypothetical protein